MAGRCVMLGFASWQDYEIVLCKLYDGPGFTMWLLAAMMSYRSAFISNFHIISLISYDATEENFGNKRRRSSMLEAGPGCDDTDPP